MFFAREKFDFCRIAFVTLYPVNLRERSTMGLRLQKSGVGAAANGVSEVRTGRVGRLRRERRHGSSLLDAMQTFAAAAKGWITGDSSAQ